MTIKELREKLESWIELMEDYEDDQQVRMVGNTFFVHSNEYIATRHGFIDLYQLVDEEEDDEW